MSVYPTKMTKQDKTSNKVADSNIKKVAVRLQGKSKQIFLALEKELILEGEKLSDNKVVLRMVEAYPQMERLQQQNQELAQQNQSKEERIEQLEQSNIELESKLRQALEGRVKDLEDSKEQEAKIRQLEQELAQKS